MSKFLFTNSKVHIKWQSVLALLVLSIATSCARPDITVPKSKYNSDSLSEDWRSNIVDRQKRVNEYNKKYGQPYAYPQDNDADYVPLKPGYRYVPKQPVQQYYAPAPRQQYIAPYPQDNDANYNTGYPVYDSEADNNPYYIINKDKKLLPPRKVDPYSAEQYDYPIYFD